MGWHLDGKVTAVVGTHTHVQTADERILPQGHGLPHRRRHDRPARRRHRRREGAGHRRFLNALPARFETATGDPRLNAVVVDADEATGRATAIERLSLSAADIDLARRWRAAVGRRARDSDRRPAVRRTRPPRAAAGAARGASDASASSPPRCATLVESRVLRGLGRRRALELPRLEHRPPLLHAQGRRRADQGRHVPLGAAPAAASSRRTACASSRAAALSVYDPRGEYQLVCEHLEPHGLGALQLAFEQLRSPARRRGPVRRGAQAAAAGAARGASASSPRSTARRCATSSRCCAAATRTRTSSSRPARVQGEGAAREIARALAPIGARRRRRRRHRRPRRRLDRRPLGVQRGSRRARHRRLPGAGHLGRRATRPTSRSPTSSPTCARRRRRPPPRSSSRRKDEFAGRIDALARPRRDRRCGRGCSGSTRRLHQLAGPPGVRRRARRASRCRQRHVAELRSALRRAAAARARRRARRRVDLLGRRARRAPPAAAAGRACATRARRPHDRRLDAALGRRASRRRDAAARSGRPAWTRSARSPCSAAATPCAGPPTARRWCAPPRRSTPGDARARAPGQRRTRLRRARGRAPASRATPDHRRTHCHGPDHQGFRSRHRRARSDRQEARGRRPAARDSRWRSTSAACSCRASATRGSRTPSGASRSSTSAASSSRRRRDLAEVEPGRGSVMTPFEAFAARLPRRASSEALDRVLPRAARAVRRSSPRRCATA